MGRYSFEHVVSRSKGVTLWRALDSSLGRPVAITMIDSDEPRAEALREAARASAALDGRSLVRVLDVFDDRGNLMVVSEWVDGRNLADTYEQRDGEPLSAAAATTVARHIATALESLHAAGQAHGRLRPSSVLLTDDGEVRIRGVGIDAALWGITGDPFDADIHGVGSLLYAALTARWPDGMADGLPAAPRAGERVLLPSQVTADVPASLDAIVSRSVKGVAGQRDRVSSMRELADALRVAEGTTSNRMRPVLTRARAARPRRLATRAVGVAASLVIIAAFATIGVLVFSNATSPWGTAPQALSSDIFTKTAEPSALAISGTEAPAGTFVPVSAELFDPAKLETDSTAKPAKAIDADETTAWTTNEYFSADFEGQRGVGIVLDLGATRSVSAVELKLIGNGSSVQVRISPTLTKDPAKWTELARADGAPAEIALRAPRPVVGQYVLLWFTAVPLDADGTYSGGVREVTVYG